MFGARCWASLSCRACRCRSQSTVASDRSATPEPSTEPSASSIWRFTSSVNKPLFRQELVVGAFFGYASAIDRRDAIAMPHGREPMRNRHARAGERIERVTHVLRIERVTHVLLRLALERACCLVEQENAPAAAYGALSATVGAARPTPRIPGFAYPGASCGCHRQCPPPQRPPRLL